MTYFYSDLTPANPKLRVYSPDSKPFVKIAHACHRCGGSGIYSQYHGVCYQCGGDGKGKLEHRRLYTQAQAEKLVARKEKARITREKKKAAELAARKADSRSALNTDITEEFKQLLGKAKQTAGLTDPNEFIQRQITKLASILESGEEWGWSENRRNAVESIFENILKLRANQKRADIAREDRSEWITEGRQVIEGEVVSCKEKESEWGVAWKLVITDGIRKYYGTLPRALDIPERGTTIKIKGTVTRANDDPLFGFFKRPVAA